jgi:hypothetical protein
MLDTSQIGPAIRQKLAQGGFTITEETGPPGKSPFLWTAFRKDVPWIGIGASHYVGYVERPTVTIEELAALFQAGFTKVFEFEDAGHRAFIVYPCVLVDTISSDAAAYAARPPKHFGKYEFPILIERSSGKAYYQRNGPIWGRSIWKKAREVAICVAGE